MWPGMKWVWNEQSFAHGQLALVIGWPRPLQILGYRRISPGFWWLSNASVLSLSNIANAQGGTVSGEREREHAYMCARAYVCV